MSTFVSPCHGILSRSRWILSTTFSTTIISIKILSMFRFLMLFIHLKFYFHHHFSILVTFLSYFMFWYHYTNITLWNSAHFDALYYAFFQPNTSGLSQWPWGIRRGSLALGCWDRRFGSCRWHGYLPLGFFACCLVSSYATVWSLVCVCVWSRNVKNEAAWSRLGL
jgi:hypothetical protein